MNPGVNSNESAFTGCDKPFSTSYSKPSTSIFTNEGIPYCLIILSSVVTSTIETASQLQPGNLLLLLTASIHSIDIDEITLTLLRKKHGRPSSAPNAF